MENVFKKWKSSAEPAVNKRNKKEGDLKATGEERWWKNVLVLEIKEK